MVLYQAVKVQRDKRWSQIPAVRDCGKQGALVTMQLGLTREEEQQRSVACEEMRAPVSLPILSGALSVPAQSPPLSCFKRKLTAVLPTIYPARHFLRGHKRPDKKTPELRIGKWQKITICHMTIFNMKGCDLWIVLIFHLCTKCVTFYFIFISTPIGNLFLLYLF